MKGIHIKVDVKLKDRNMIFLWSLQVLLLRFCFNSYSRQVTVMMFKNI